MTISLIIVIVMGALFVGALLYLGAGKSVKPRPKKSDSFGPLVLILLPLMSWMAYTQINKEQYSLFNAYPALNYIVIAVFVGAFIWEKGKAKG
jgi:hypothetical protein